MRSSRYRSRLHRPRRRTVTPARCSHSIESQQQAAGILHIVHGRQDTVSAGSIGKPNSPAPASQGTRRAPIARIVRSRGARRCRVLCHQHVGAESPIVDSKWDRRIEIELTSVQTGGASPPQASEGIDVRAQKNQHARNPQRLRRQYLEVPSIR